MRCCVEKFVRQESFCFRNYRLKMTFGEQERFGDIMNWNWVLTVGIVWFIIYMFMVQDFGRFKKIVLYITVIVIVVCTIPILVIVFTAKEFCVPYIMSSDIKHLMNVKVIPLLSGKPS